VIRTLRLVMIAIGSLVIAALAMALVGSWLPQVLGSWTVPVATIVLGGLIFQDIARRDTRSQRAKSGPS
jgi:hypothetical protein